MRTLYSIYEEYVCEAFVSNIMRMIKQDIETSTSYNFAKLVDKVYIDDVRWDKVEDSDIETLPGTDQSMWYFRALKAGKDSFGIGGGKRLPIKDHKVVIFYYRNDKIIGIYSPNWDRFYHNSNGQFEYIERPREAESYMKTADTWYVISISNNDASKIRTSREQAQNYMIPDLDIKDRQLKHDVKGVLGREKGGFDNYRAGKFFSYCERMIEEAKRRYKEIIAKNKAAGSSTDKIDALVQETLNRLTQITVWFNKNRDKLDYSWRSKLESVMKLMYGESKAYGSGRNVYSYISGGLMKLYEDYCKTWWSLGERDTYTDMYMKDFKMYEKLIIQTVDKFNTYYEEFKSQF